MSHGAISMFRHFLTISIFSLFYLTSPAVVAQSHPTCPDDSYFTVIGGNGIQYGWFENATCVADDPVDQMPDTNSTPYFVAECIDTDGDGWGWNGTRSCVRGCYDGNDDGWGWDGRFGCRVSPSVTPRAEIVAGVTDVVLMAGQSNALGERTTVEYPGKDSPTPKVIVWSEFNGWQVADLCFQVWDKGFYPWSNGDCSNHPAFQIARHIVEIDPSRKVAIIPTGTGAMPISWWDRGSVEMLSIDSKVTAALDSLVDNPYVDFIAWSQGESDHQREDLWFIKLNDLINRFRETDWFDSSSGIFIAQETAASSVNERVRDLGEVDNDPLTDWVAASDLKTMDGVHWSGDSLREIGERFAERYLSLIN